MKFERWQKAVESKTNMKEWKSVYENEIILGTEKYCKQK